MLSSLAKRLWGSNSAEDRSAEVLTQPIQEGSRDSAWPPTTTCPGATTPSQSQAHAALQQHELVEDAADLDRQKALFLSQAAQAYGYGGRLDSILTNEFHRLQGQVYLDHAGAGLYSEVELEASFQQLKSQLFTNPHSQASPGNPSADAVEQLRRLTLQLCNASGQEYHVVFTSGATSALKLVRADAAIAVPIVCIFDGWGPRWGWGGGDVEYKVACMAHRRGRRHIRHLPNVPSRIRRWRSSHQPAPPPHTHTQVAECFPWGPGSCLAHPLAAHNSVLGMREAAFSAGAHVQLVDVATSAGAAVHEHGQRAPSPGEGTLCIDTSCSGGAGGPAWGSSSNTHGFHGARPSLTCASRVSVCGFACLPYSG